MAVVVHTVSEALTICGVNNAALFQGHTAETRLATDIFIDTYESMKDKTFDELDAYFKSYSDLTALQGQIRLLPGVKRNIKSLIQWVQDQFLTGLNPQNNVFPIADVTLLLRRQKSHALFIMKSKIIVNSAKPTKYSDSTKWDDWNPTFVNFLRSIPGGDGVPLSYVQDSGKPFIIVRALYGLKSSGASFRSFLAQHLDEIGFRSLVTDLDVWRREAINPDGELYYEYALVYVDNIMIVALDPSRTMKQVQEKFKFKGDKWDDPDI